MGLFLKKKSQRAMKRYENGNEDSLYAYGSVMEKQRGVGSDHRE